MAKKIKMGKWKRVEVIWIDSTSVRVTGKSWHRHSEIVDAIKDGYHIRTSGYLFEQDDQYIAVAAHMSMEKEKPALFGDVTLIPKGCIKSIKNI